MNRGDIITMTLAVGSLAFASFVAGRGVGQGEFQPSLYMCERRLDAANDRADLLRNGPLGCICEPVTTVYPDAGLTP